MRREVPQGRLAWRQIASPRTHDIGELAALLPPAIELPLSPEDQEALADHAVVTRYPGVWEPIELEAAQRAVAMAGSVRAAMRPHLDLS